MKNKNIRLLIILFIYALPVLASTAIQFVDVTENAGINFHHVNGAEGAFHIPETLGAGGAFFDADNDGFLDIYLVNSGYWDKSPSARQAVSALYRNNRDGTFTDTTTAAKVENRGNYGQGAACADYNNDGNVDLYVTNFGANVLYRNNGDGTFTDVTVSAGVGDPGWSSSACFLDYNTDGYLDLFVVNYLVYSIDLRYQPCGEDGIQTYCHPSLFEGAPDTLYRNNGDGTFTDVSQAAGVGGVGGMFHGKGLGVVSADFNNDGVPDLYVANDDTRNDFFYNNGDGTFSEISLLAGCAYSFNGIAQAGMGVAVADYNADSWLDIFVTNLSYETNALYRNNGDGTFTDVIYEAHLGKESFLFVGFGTGFFDADNDGWQDIFIANGHILDNIEDTHDVLTYRQPDQLFRNSGDSTFQEVSESAGAYFQRTAVSRGALFGDYDNDGDVDMLVTQSNGPATLLENWETQSNSVSIKTVGVISNRDGIGTRITLTAGGHTQIQEVNPGASYLSSHDPRCHFGLGTNTVIDRLEVRWQSGVVQVFENLPVNQVHVISEFSETPTDTLFKAAWTGDVSTFRGMNIDVNLKDIVGRTPLHIAAEKGNVDAAMFLIENGANVNVADANGNTPLVFVINKTGNLKITERLLEKGASVNAQNRTGETALMYAAWHGHSAIVQLLLENRADVTLKNRQGNTALTLAESKGHQQIVEMLKASVK